MNLEKYKAMNNLSTNDIVEMLKPDFPKFDKRQVTMVTKGTYGVVLAPKAVKALNAAHPAKKENRVRGNKLTVRLNDYLFALLLERCDSTGHTKQDAVEMAIYSYLKPEARRTQPRELNSKPEQRRGKWEEKYDPEDTFMARKWYCSCCGDYTTYGETPYCPYCGALMGDEDDV